MPIHDWSRVDAGIFHHFHQGWTSEIANALNGGDLPDDYFALAEQVVSGPIPDVVTLQQRAHPTDVARHNGGIAVAEAPPQARFVREANLDPYVARANRIRIQHRLGRVVAIIEIVSPGNKSSQNALRAFVQKAEDLLRDGINLLIVDLFPPTPRDPQGVHQAIWDTIQCEPFELPSDKPLTIAAYSAGAPIRAYVDPVAVGDLLPSSPIFLDAGLYVPAPLEETYEKTWANCPRVVKELVSNGGQ